MQYLAIEAESTKELNEKVGEKIKDGWKPLGGLSVGLSESDDYRYFVVVQAMTTNSPATNRSKREMSTKFIVELPDGLDVPEATKMAYVKTAIQCWGSTRSPDSALFPNNWPTAEVKVSPLEQQRETPEST